MTSQQPRVRPLSKLSKHAAVRTQQRCIPQVIVDALQDWGDCIHAGAGAFSYFFSKRSWGRFCAYLGVEAKRFERYRNAYVVAANDGTVITVCWRL
jgi:hypothetical protein